MQANTFIIGLMVAGFLASMYVFFRGLVAQISFSEACRRHADYPRPEKEAEVDRLRAIAKKRNPRNGVIMICVTFAVGLAIPSTQTLCAMFVLPRITASEAIQKDLPEIYNLAVEKLKSSLK